MKLGLTGLRIIYSLCFRNFGYSKLLSERAVKVCDGKLSFLVV
jgi:hypothetical protein